MSTVHRDFTFNGVRYGVNLPVTADLSWKTWLLGYEYDFLYRDRWFVGFVAQLKATDVQVNLQAPIGTDFVRAQAPIPNIGGIARVYVVPNISITGELVGVLQDSGERQRRLPRPLLRLRSLRHGELQRLRRRPVGLSQPRLGYIIDKDQGDFKMKGIYFGGVVRY